MKALFASPLSFAASILSSSSTESRLRLRSSGDGTEDGGVDVDAGDDREEVSLISFGNYQSYASQLICVTKSISSEFSRFDRCAMYQITMIAREIVYRGWE